MRSTFAFRQSGMTLIEIAVTMAIFSVVLLVSMTMMSNLSDGVNVQDEVTGMHGEANQLAGKLDEMLRAARVPTGTPAPEPNWFDGNPDLTGGANEIRFLVPVDHDDDGDFVNASLGIEWGSIRPDATPAAGVSASFIQGSFRDTSISGGTTTSATNRFYTIIRFQRAAGAAGTLSEAVHGADINRDGDQDDTFQVGRLQVVYPAGNCTTGRHNGQNLGELVMDLCGDIVIVGADTDSDGLSDPDDLDQDGDLDPIFQLNGSRLTVKIFTARTDTQDPLLQNVTTNIELRNMNGD